MPSKPVIGSRYDNTFNTEPMHRISCCCIYHMWPLATDSRLLQICTVFLPLYADGTKKKQAYASEGNLEEGYRE
jgi:hypothetical protein